MYYEIYFKKLNIIDHILFVRYVKTANSVVLDYSVNVIQLDEKDFLLDYGELGNFSVAGFEMILHRHVSHYLITYYLPSGINDNFFIRLIFYIV